MSSTVLAAFAATCVLLAVTPGPNMALIIAATLSGGLGPGLATLLGCLTGLTILVTVAAVGMTSVMVLMAEWLEVIRWLGALYLMLLGIRQLLSWWRARHLPEAPAAAVPSATPASYVGRYVQAIAVSLSNPKVLLFLGAFFPQFVSPDAAPGPQLALLAVMFVVLLAGVDLAFTLAIAKARATIDMRRLRFLDGLSGGLLVAGGLVLATARRP